MAACLSGDMLAARKTLFPPPAAAGRRGRAAAPPLIAAVRVICQRSRGCQVLLVIIYLFLFLLFFLYLLCSWASSRLSCFAQSQLRRLFPALRAAGFHSDARASLQHP